MQELHAHSEENDNLRSLTESLLFIQQLAQIYTNATFTDYYKGKKKIHKERTDV